MSPPPVYHHEQFCFVFGSNLKGRHGKGAADVARRFYRAQEGVGEGATGNAYALPTKDAKLEPRSWHDVAGSCEQFLDYAASRPETDFMLTRVGCGLAGFADEDMAELFRAAPDNVWLPRKWQVILDLEGTDIFRIIIAGSQSFLDYDLLCRKMDFLLSKRTKDKIMVVSGHARKGADPLGERYAKERGIELVCWPAAWKTFDKPAGYLRNHVMAWYSDALAVFKAGNTPGSKMMHEIAESEGIPVREQRVA